MNLHLLPNRTGSAAENMALDFLLLQRYPEPAAARFRHYDWRAPAFTFGVSQKIDFVRARLPAGERVDLCRRPTGGGIVDHRNDWTYALVLPRGHALYAARATQSYRVVHESLAAALVACRVPAVLKAVFAAVEGAPAVPGVCFERAELFDVVHGPTGAKLAGAAQKRNKHGLLMQGSIDKAACGTVDWDDLQDRFAAALAPAVGAAAGPMPWPDLAEDEVAGLIEQYASPDWIEGR